MANKSFTIEQLAQLTNCKLIGNPDHVIYGVSDLEQATIQDASFLANPRYQHAMQSSNAGVICIDEKTTCSDQRNYLISSQPSAAFQKIIELFHPQRQSPSGFSGIHPTAVIHPTATIAENASIGPYAVIDEGTTIGARTFIGSGAYVGPNTIIGTDCTIHPRVVIREECIVGNHVIIQPGAIIGSCGFGYITDKQGIHTKLNQVGNVKIEDHVEIGANTTIDRSRFKSTVVGKGTKIDNLVQLGHGVELGPYNMIVAQTGISGSTSTGRHVVLAGQVAVAGHLHLDDGVMVAGKSGVSKSLPTGKYNGVPALPIAEYNRTSVYLRNIETYVKQIKALEERINLLEKAK